MRGGLELTGMIVRRSIVLALGLAPALGCGDSAGRRFLTIGTGGTGGIYYPLGGAVAGLLSAGDTTRRYTAEVTGGSVENVNRVLSGGMDLGFSIGTTAWETFHRQSGGPGDRLRVVAPLYPNTTHVLVARGVAATSVAEFRGLRVSVGAAGSGTEQVARHVLEAHGLGYGDVRPVYLSFSESAAALRDGAIDAAILSVGYPASAVLEALTGAAARLVPVSTRAVDALSAGYPFYSPGSIPEGIYPGMTQPLPTVSVHNWIVSRDDLDAEVVAAVLRLLDEEREALARVHDIARQIDLGALDRAPIPLHDATATWWAGRGGRR